jgi:hypothetical protein
LRQDQAKPAILAEWREWAADRNMVNPHGFEALMFFEFLRQERSHLLSFKAAGDNWQTVHCCTPPRKVTYFEPVPPRLAGNTIIESTFEVGRRFRCTMHVDCSQLDARRGDQVGTRRMAPAYARAPRRKRSLRTGALAAMRSISSPP